MMVAALLLSSGILRLTAEEAREEDMETTHRRLAEALSVPSYMQSLMDELKERKKLFAEAEVIKYWFEYTGPLQVSFNGLLDKERLFLFLLP